MSELAVFLSQHQVTSNRDSLLHLFQFIPSIKQVYCLVTLTLVPGLSLFSQELLGYECHGVLHCGSGGIILWQQPSISPNFFSFIIIKIPLMAKYSRIFLYSNLLITLGFWFILIIAVWGEGDQGLWLMSIEFGFLVFEENPPNTHFSFIYGKKKNH